MSDRAALLTAIRVHLGDDTPRLVYADWLDEHPESDRDTATAEFIRASCLGRNHPTGYMPRKAYQWLHENWQRLVPETLGLHVRRFLMIHEETGEVSSDMGWSRSGRDVEAYIRMPFGSGDGILVSCRTVFEFNRGFLQWWTVHRPGAFDRIRGALAVDQPLARCRKFPLDAEWGWK
ncbi:hypothetical protein VT84_33260 [Gemmata sp. SH-PL17]|uniref:TIGR02996 domain-containing protein n=1 Tax=Gemmata sp. SH-PL17 TaxID=1630693 RepID=UPI00078E5C98|nr:TIGR02996 domain-containing protein [Gemmata sp. SH-PL17]AMV29312.1 hypothetical protein VT84_33260 [Gemmata sp. SH-PL17]